MKLFGLIGWILLSFTGALPAVFIPIPSSWYDSLSKPSWTPPNWLFGPVWSLLYLMMGISVWFIWTKKGFAGAPLPLSLFIVQIALNILWTVLFFGFQQIGAATLEIIVLWIMILACIYTFYPISKFAALLLTPYLIWVSYASALTIAIYMMNR